MIKKQTFRSSAEECLFKDGNSLLYNYKYHNEKPPKKLIVCNGHRCMPLSTFYRLFLVILFDLNHPTILPFPFIYMGKTQLKDGFVVIYCNVLLSNNFGLISVVILWCYSLF